MIEVGLLSEIFCLTAGLLSCVISPTEWTAPTASSFYCREGIICLSIHAVQHNKIKKREKKRHRELNMQKGNLCFKPGIDIQAVWSNNSWPFSYKIGNAYLCCVILSLSLSVFYFIRFCFSPPPPAMPVMNLNYGKVTFHSVDLSVVLFELAVLPHYYGILIDSLNPLQTRATKMWERYWLSSNFGWQNWQHLFMA